MEQRIDESAELVRGYRAEAAEGNLTALLNTPVEKDPQVVTSSDERFEATVYTTEKDNRRICTLYLEDKDPSWFWRIPPFCFTLHSDEIEVFEIPRENKYHFGAIGLSYTEDSWGRKHVVASVPYVAQGDKERLHGTKTVRLRR